VTKQQAGGRRWRTGCMTLTATALLFGCSHMAGQVAEEATEQPLAALANEEQNLANIEKILASPEMQASVHALASALARGLVDGLFGPDGPPKLDAEATEQLVRERVEPVVASMMRTAVGAAMDETLAVERRELVRETAAGLTAAMVDAMMDELGEGIEEDIAPALARAMNEQLGPALAQRLDDDELRGAVGSVAHELAYQVVLGTNAGVAELASRAPAAEESFWTRITQYFSIGSIALAVALIVLLVVLVRNARARRRLTEETQRRENTLISLIQAMTLRDATPEERRELLALLDRGNAGPSEDVQKPEPPRRWWNRFAMRTS
jgi:hypothetical protein